MDGTWCATTGSAVLTPSDDLTMLVRSVVVWLVILAVAFANGALREIWIIPRMGPQTGHVLSTLILCAAILLSSWLTIRWMRPASSSAAWKIGVVWLVLTEAFEFLAGYYVFGVAWSQLLADYNLAQGRIWALVLLTTATAPALSAHGRGLISGVWTR